MLCSHFILFVIAIVSCGAQEISEAQESEIKLNVVSLPAPAQNSDARIIGGTATNILKYPFIVQILYILQFICGGSLITQRHVLSAAHCFYDQNGFLVGPANFSIRAGTTYLNTGGAVYPVLALTVHSQYYSPPRDHDIAVMLLSSYVTLSANVQLATIPFQGATFPDNSAVVVIGWGRTNVNVAAASSVLNEVAVRKVNRTVCAERYNFLANLSGEPFPVTDNMLCAGLLDVGGADACQGDSGGPLIYQGVVVGITSWGYSCAQPLYPGVYARVASFSTWVNNTVNSLVPNDGVTQSPVTTPSNSTAPAAAVQTAAVATTVLIALTVSSALV